MSLNLQVALRFITSRKRSMAMSLAGIVFGIGFFIITQAQTSGFETFFIQTIIGTDSPIRIENRQQSIRRTVSTKTNSGQRVRLRSQANQKYIAGIDYPHKLCQALEHFDQISAVSELVKGSVNATSTFSSSPAQVLGIRLQDHLQVTNLANQIMFGDLADFRLNSRSVIIGSRLAAMLDLRVGDSIILGAGKNKRRYPVVAVFETGIGDIDKRRIFMHLPEARSLLNKPFGKAIFQLQLKDVGKAPEVAEHIESALRYKAVSWQEREKTWLEVFRALRLSSAITVSSIILIAGLGMFNTLAMLVLEKTKEIAILRSMGFTRRDVSRIFLWQGAVILMLGTVLGWLFGASATYGISKLPIRIRGIFSTDTFVVNWDINHYLWAAIIATIVVMIASYIPARRAASLEPGAIIRGTSG